MDIKYNNALCILCYREKEKMRKTLTIYTEIIHYMTTCHLLY